MKRKHLLPAAAGATAAMLVALIWINRDRFAPLDSGARAPDYTVFSLDGDTVQLSDYRGQVVLLNVWATWCKPCVYEMPALQRLHDQLHEQGLSIVAVSVDAPGGSFGPFGQVGGDIRAFVHRFGLTFDVLHDPSGDIQMRYQVNGLPTTYLIDREGRIRRKLMSAAEWDKPPLLTEVQELLES